MTQTNLRFDYNTQNMLEDGQLGDTFLPTESDIDLDPCDLSEWLDRQYDSSTDTEQFSENKQELTTVCAFSEGVFEDCKEDEDEHVQTYSKQYRRRASRSPPRRRARNHSPVRTNQVSYESLVNPPHPFGTPVPVVSSPGDTLYNAALNNLASSMKRSELSRIQVLRHRETLSRAPRRRETISCVTTHRDAISHVPMHRNNLPRTSVRPALSNLSSLSDLLSGKRTALTAGLEQSRKQLRMYMSLMNTNQPL